MVTTDFLVVMIMELLYIRKLKTSWRHGHILELSCSVNPRVCLYSTGLIYSNYVLILSIELLINPFNCHRKLIYNLLSDKCCVQNLCQQNL